MKRYSNVAFCCVRFITRINVWSCSHKYQKIYKHKTTVN
jgi:hypothetical protein